MGKPERAKDIVTSDYLSKLKYKVTSDLVTKRDKKHYTSGEARNKAMYLASKLNNPTRTMFYLKCAWNLSDSYLDRLLRIALTKDDPIRYFSFSAAQEMRQNS